MGGNFGTKWAYGMPHDPSYTKDGMRQCTGCGRVLGFLIWRQPHRITVSASSPARWPDILFGSAMYDLMVSARLKTAIEETGLTGIPAFAPAAEVVRAGRKKASDMPELPVYHNVYFTHPGAEIDEVASQYLYPPRPADAPPECPVCHAGRPMHSRNVGYHVLPGSWQGHDIFDAGPAVLVTEKFVRVCEGRGICGVYFMPSERFVFDMDHHPPFYEMPG